MIVRYSNKINFMLFEGFARVCTVSAYFPDNPGMCHNIGRNIPHLINLVNMSVSTLFSMPFPSI